MLSDEEELRNIKETQEAYAPISAYATLEPVPFSDEELLSFHKYMKSLAQDLLGEGVDLDKDNLVFLLTDDKYPNAAHVDYPKAGGKKFIHFSAALFDFIENKDQLGFILGHELQHYLEKKEHGVHKNNKLEEVYSDLSAVPKMARAGLNIEEAKHIADKMFVNKRILKQHLIDEHLSDPNRKTLLDMWITAERKKLRTSGRGSDDVTGSKAHPLEENITSLVHNRPKQKGLREFFSSEKYLNATYEEKVDMWFAQFEDKLTLRDNEKLGMVYADLDPLDDKVFKEERAKLLRAAWANGPSNYNYRFEEKFLECMLNEKSWELAASKARVMDYAADYNEGSLNLSPEKFGDYIKEKFGNLREITDVNQAKLTLLNMRIINNAVSNQQWYELTEKKVLNLSYSNEDIGKTISKEVLFAEGKYTLSRYFDIDPVGNDIVLRDGDTWFLLDKEGVINAVEKDQSKIQDRVIANQINETVKVLDDIRAGKEVDFELKLDVLKKAWLMSSPDVVEVLYDGSKVLTVSERSRDKGLEIYGEGKTFDMARIEQYLNPEAKAFWDERYEPEKPQPYADFIVDTLVKGIKEEYTTETLNDNIEYMLEDMHVEGISQRLEASEKIAKAFLGRTDATFPESIVRKIASVKLDNHLKAGKNLDDFEFPFEQEYKAHIEHLKEDGAYKEIFDNDMGTYYAYELLKKKPDIDLSQIIFEEDGGAVSALGTVSMIFLGGVSEEFHGQLKRRIQENISDPKNWGDGTIAEGMTDAPFTVRLNEITKAFHQPFVPFEQVEMLSDVSLHFYQQASVKDKIDYFVETIGNTINRRAEEEKNTATKEKIWSVIRKDFENKDITLEDRLSLFLAASKNNLFDEAKIHYFDTLVGRDGNGGLLKEIEEAPEPKFGLYVRLLDGDTRIPDPEIRGKVISLAVKQFHKENGSYNDMTASHEDRVDFSERFAGAVYQMNVANKVPEIDRHQFLRELAEVTLAQKELCQVIKPDPSQIDTQNKKLIAGAYGLDGLTAMLQHDIIRREHVINYLLSNGSAEETDTALSLLRGSVLDSKYFGSSNYVRKRADEYMNMLTPQYLTLVKKEFDAAPLEAKGAIINLLSENDGWEQHFDLVADKLFHDAGALGNMGKKFLKAYISSREGSERCFYLSAMYAAANNKTATFDDGKSPYTKEQRALAQGLRMFLENSGPAGVKLAQAMSSYSDVPDFIRDEMQNAKNNANPPARWEVFEWLENAGENDALAHGKLGKLLGSASFFVTYDMKGDDGKDKVVKFLRQGSKDLADAEFVVYKDMLRKMKDEFKDIESFDRLVNNAASMVDVETNLDIGEQQLRDAQKLYPNTSEGDGVTFKVNVMDWEARGKIWAAMEKAEGIDFKDLDQPYKKAAAKAVFTMELANMLSGERFDSDRHAGQYKFDAKTNTIGVFDTGSISVVEPTEKEKKVLGVVLANTVKTLMNGDGSEAASTLCAEIDKGIAAFYKKEIEEGKPIPPYLSEFQRGLLALTDFHKEIPAKELGVCLMQALNTGKHQLDKDIYKGFTQAMLEQKADSRMEISDFAATCAGAIMTSTIALEKEAVMTKEAALAQTCGKIMGAKIIEEGSGYGLLTHLPEQMKSEAVLDVLQSELGQFHFAKGVAKEVLSKMDPKNYSAEEKRQVGALLYKVVEQGARQKKLHQEVSLPKIFEEMAAKEPKLGQYAKGLLTVAKIAAKFDMTTDVEVFKRAVILGRLADKEVQKGYMEALRKSPDSSFIKKALSHVNPVTFMPKKQARKAVKFVMKKVAPKCGEMITQMAQNKVQKEGNSHA